MGTYYLPNNLGKQAITLNLGAEEGRALLHRLIRDLPVDIFATNQRPRSYARLGIDAPTLQAIRPDLIWVGISGFGPGHDEPAYDPILQARAGFMDLTGEPGGTPLIFGLPMVDLGAAEHAYGQVMRALVRRAATGDGSVVEISMFHSALSWMATPVMLTASFGEKVERRGNRHPFFAPVSVYPTSDGYAYVAVGTDDQWKRLAALPGFESLADPNRERNAGRISAVEVLDEEIAGLTRGRTTSDLLASLRAAGVPAAPVLPVDQVCADPLLAGHMVRAQDPVTGREIRVPAPPVVTEHLKDNDLEMSFPPRLGEHNEAIFGGLGLDVVALREEGLV
jgi:formyl-CoA transferase